MEAVTIVTNLQQELYDDIGIDEKEDIILQTPKRELVANLCAKLKTCQNCNKQGHEFLNCPSQDCVYCSDSTHKSVNCQVIPSGMKFSDICKNCGESGHYIDFCNCDGEFCQLCQRFGHKANNCIESIVKYCYKCKNLSHNNGTICPFYSNNLQIQNRPFQQISNQPLGQNFRPNRFNSKSAKFFESK